MKFYYPTKPTRISIDSSIFEECNLNPNYILQIKKNGWRVQIHRDGKEVQFYTRHNKRLESIVPDADWTLLINEVLKIEQDSFVLDGEFLHRRGNLKNTLYIWDIFELNHSLVRKSYGERKHITDSIIKPSENLFTAKDYAPGTFKHIWDELTNPAENEGIVLKDVREALYVSHKQSSKSLSAKQFKILLDDKRNYLEGVV